MIIFAICVLLLALILQRFRSGRDLEHLQGDRWPKVRVVEPEEPFQVVVRLENRSRRWIPYLRVRLRFPRGLTPCHQGKQVQRDVWGNYGVSFSAWLRGRQRLERCVPVTAARRGRYVLPALTLLSGDFLGLEEQGRDCGSFAEVIAAPRPARLPRLPQMFGGFMGEVSVNRFIMEDPVLTLGYREYSGREPMKMISWTQSARRGSLMVKQYDYTLEPKVSVVLNVDTSRPDREDLLETCFSMTRTVCELLEKQGVKYDFVTNAILAGGAFDPGAAGEGLGDKHFQGILERLGRATARESMSFERLVTKEAARGSAAGRILITPGDEGRDLRALERLREASGGNLMILRAVEVEPCC